MPLFYALLSMVFPIIPINGDKFFFAIGGVNDFNRPALASDVLLIMS